MKIFHWMLVFGLFQLSVICASAQEFEVPKNISLENKDDFERYTEQVLQCIDWLEKTPAGEQQTKRTEANRFLLTWLAGTNQVTIEVSIVVKDIVKKNPDLLMIFMGGWAAFELNDNSSKTDLILANKAGIRSAIQAYELNLDHGYRKNKKLEKLKKKDLDNTLEAWIQKKLEN